ncbi:hypothetical protein V1515DRAFT_612668 [Lipomyces mesembrius]
MQLGRPYQARFVDLIHTVTTIRCEIGEELGRYVGDQLGGWLNHYVGFDSGTLFVYASMLDPFVIRSCVVPPNDLMSKCWSHYGS